MRKLTQQEIAILEERGCQAEDWTSVSVDDAFRTDGLLNVSMYGEVEIGCLDGSIEVEEGFVRKCGIRNACLRDVTIGDGCLIENVHGYISSYNIGEQCLICDIGTISAQGAQTFGNGNVVSVLNEGGDGNVVIYDKLTAQIAQLMLQSKAVIEMAQREVASRPVTERGEIGRNVRIQHVREICNTKIEDSCEIQSASHISNSTLGSSEDAPTLIGADVIVENSVVAQGATVTDGAKVDNSYVGEAVHVGKGFSSEASLFFANTYMDNGEACAAFCGPFTCSHHKSTLLIGGQFSFYNAGSGTNQSNHAYKMGPIHWGILERGSKTASGSHILWPAHFGPFTMVMGKIQSHPRVQNLPFSYAIADGLKTYLVPGINIRTVGTWRDVGKWPKRDQRSKCARRDIINFAFPNPFIIQSVVAGRDILRKLEKQQGVDIDEYEYGGCHIKRTSLQRGIRYYDLIIRLFLYEHFNNAGMTDLSENDYATNAWADVCGMLAPKSEIDRVIKDIESADIVSSDELVEILQQIHKDYSFNASAYAISLMQSEGGNMFVDQDYWMKEAEEAHSLWLKMVRDDAEREYQMGDVEEDMLREFVEKVK